MSRPFAVVLAITVATPSYLRGKLGLGDSIGVSAMPVAGGGLLTVSGLF